MDGENGIPCCDFGDDDNIDVHPLWGIPHEFFHAMQHDPDSVEWSQEYYKRYSRLMALRASNTPVRGIIAAEAWLFISDYPGEPEVKTPEDIERIVFPPHEQFAWTKHIDFAQIRRLSHLPHVVWNHIHYLKRVVAFAIDMCLFKRWRRSKRPLAWDVEQSAVGDEPLEIGYPAPVVPLYVLWMIFSKTVLTGSNDDVVMGLINDLLLEIGWDELHLSRPIHPDDTPPAFVFSTTSAINYFVRIALAESPDTEIARRTQGILITHFFAPPSRCIMERAVRTNNILRALQLCLEHTEAEAPIQWLVDETARSGCRRDVEMLDACIRNLDNRQGSVLIDSA